MILQKDLSGGLLAKEISSLIESSDAIGEMEKAARRLARSDGGDRIVELRSFVMSTEGKQMTN
jgi:UDP-N-acetylglucosamine:LPS N-acetylglucosamine transferase